MLLDMANHPNRNKGRLPAPTGDEIRAARETAGLTQEQAAELAMLGAQSRWAEYENGTRKIEPSRWALFKHLAGIERLPWKPTPHK
jgi:transcriptional regulator with XRE-family HTH domain